MNRYPSEQLMTVEEAERLCELHTGRNRRKRPARQPSLWAWQTVCSAAPLRTDCNPKSGCPRLLPR